MTNARRWRGEECPEVTPHISSGVQEPRRYGWDDDGFHGWPSDEYEDYAPPTPVTPKDILVRRMVVAGEARRILRTHEIYPSQVDTTRAGSLVDLWGG